MSKQTRHSVNSSVTYFQCHNNAHHQPTTCQQTNIQLCISLLETPLACTHNGQVWLDTLKFIESNYAPNPPNFRSGLHQYINSQKKQDLMAVQAILVKATLTTSKPFSTSASDESAWNTSSSPFGGYWSTSKCSS